VRVPEQVSVPPAASYVLSQEALVVAAPLSQLMPNAGPQPPQLTEQFWQPVVTCPASETAMAIAATFSALGRIALFLMGASGGPGSRQRSTPGNDCRAEREADLIPRACVRPFSTREGTL